MSDKRIVTVDYLESDYVKNTDINQTFEPTSTKAASGKAVNEAISGIQPIDENTEFIFDGGDVDGGVSVDIVVDTVLSKTSNNPIANKPVAIKFSEILGVIEQAKKDILLSAYPIGSIYISTVSTSPSTLFGGTWERIKDTFLLAAGSTYNAGTTGGEATHTLTVDEMPSHNHKYNSERSGYEGGTLGGIKVSYGTAYDNVEVAGILNTGGNQPHNNMPPYLAVYVWKRTA